MSKNRARKKPSATKADKSNITVPEPEMTPHKKFKSPLDQQIYETRAEYDAHCKEEHDVL